LKSIHPSLIAVVSALLVLPGLAFLAIRLALPGDASYPMVNFQELVPDGLVVKPLLPDPQGLQNGDVVMASQKRAVNQTNSGSNSPQNTSNSAYLIEYKVQRGGSILQLDVPPTPLPIARVFRENWSIYVYIIYMELVSLFVFIKRPRLFAAQLFLVVSSALFSSGLVFCLGLGVDALLYPWLVGLYLLGVVVLFGFMLAAFVHLALIFPKHNPILLRHPRWVKWIYIGVLLPMVLFLAIRGALFAPPMKLLVLLVQGTGFIAVVYVPMILASTVSNYFTGTVPEKRQLRWLMWGSVIGLVPYLVFQILPSLANLPYQLTNSLVGILWMAVPTSFVIAVLYERVFDIDIIIRRTLVYVPLTAILAGLYSASVTLFQKLFIASTGQKSDVAVVMSTLILASFFTPIKNGLQASVDKHFKEPKDPLDELKAFSKRIDSVAEVINTRRTTRRLLDMAISAFQADCGAIYLDQDGELVLTHSSERWKEGSGILRLKMCMEDKQVGVMVLGARKDHKAYSPEDCKTLQQVVNCVAEMVWLAQVSPQMQRKSVDNG
jgi:hypothetical protein